MIIHQPISEFIKGDSMKNKRVKAASLFLTVFLMLGLFSCSAPKETLDTVRAVDFDRYLGKWYEIARLPNRFEKGMFCVTATYSLKKSGKKIRVTNAGYVEGSKLRLKTTTGTARIPNALRPGELKVSFFFPFSGDYYIIDLDEEEYSYALVGSPSKDYLWILSRTPEMDEDTYRMLVDVAAGSGFNTRRLIRREQNCGN